MTMSTGDSSDGAIQVPIIKTERKYTFIPRSRSMNDLPGGVRVPIVQRSNSRLKDRLAASLAGLEELKILKETQRKILEQTVKSSCQPLRHAVSTSALPSDGTNQDNQKTPSRRYSAQILGGIKEEEYSSGGVNPSCEPDRSYMKRSRSRRPLSIADAEEAVVELETPNKINTSLPSTDSGNGRTTPVIGDDDAFISSQGAQSQMPPVKRPLTTRRSSMQCEAILTGSKICKSNTSILSGIDTSCAFPSPLHAVLRQYGAVKTDNTPVKGRRFSTFDSRGGDVNQSHVNSKSSKGADKENVFLLDEAPNTPNEHPGIAHRRHSSWGPSLESKLVTTKPRPIQRQSSLTDSQKVSTVECCIRQLKRQNSFDSVFARKMDSNHQQNDALQEKTRKINLTIPESNSIGSTVVASNMTKQNSAIVNSDRDPRSDRPLQQSTPKAKSVHKLQHNPDIQPQCAINKEQSVSTLLDNRSARSSIEIPHNRPQSTSALNPDAKLNCCGGQSRANVSVIPEKVLTEMVHEKKLPVPLPRSGSRRSLFAESTCEMSVSLESNGSAEMTTASVRPAKLLVETLPEKQVFCSRPGSRRSSFSGRVREMEVKTGSAESTKTTEIGTKGEAKVDTEHLSIVTDICEKADSYVDQNDSAVNMTMSDITDDLPSEIRHTRDSSCFSDDISSDIKHARHSSCLSDEGYCTSSSSNSPGGICQMHKSSFHLELSNPTNGRKDSTIIHTNDARDKQSCDKISANSSPNTPSRASSVSGSNTRVSRDTNVPHSQNLSTTDKTRRSFKETAL